jgi:ankyrin repeat protein
LVTDPNAIPGAQAAQFIYDQLAKGQDIEVGFFWSDKDGKLIELGADVNYADQRGFTPLMFTATTLRGHDLLGTGEERNHIAGMLVEHGADVNHAAGGGRAISDGETTLHFAAADGNAGLVRTPLAAGANRMATSNQGYTLDVARFRTRNQVLEGNAGA